MPDNPRALEATAVLSQQWRRGASRREQRRGSLRLVLTAEPAPIRNGSGEVVGVDGWVRLFDGSTEVRIDPHRRIINPPLQVVDVPERRDEHGEIATPRVLRNAPDEAFWEVVWDSVTRHPNPGGRGTVTTVFASTADGYISSTDTTYSNARSGSSLSANTGPLANFVVGQRFSDPDYRCRELFVSFDTSSIPDDDIVSAVDLDLWLVSDASSTDFTCEARESDWGASLTTADWVSGASLGGLSLMATLGTSSIGSTGEYKTFTSETAFLSATNLKTGTVHLLLSSSRHRIGNTPTGTEDLTLRSADTSGTAEDPKLTITHETPNTPPTANAGTDQQVDERETVFLDGTGSTDAEDGQAGLDYEWTVLDDGGTGLTNNDISNRLTDSASFTAPTITGADVNIVIQLEVTDSGDLSDTDTVTITVSDISLLIEHTSAGGIVLGGQADSELERFRDLVEVAGQEGMALGGDAVEEFQTFMLIVYTGQGGLAFNGQADSETRLVPIDYTGLGGIVFGGVAVTDIQRFRQLTLTGQGGLSLNGAALVEFKRYRVTIVITEIPDIQVTTTIAIPAIETNLPDPSTETEIDEDGVETFIPELSS